jgi:hypothetical protein
VLNCPEKPKDRVNQEIDRLAGLHQPNKIYQTEITESVRTPGKYEASIDCVPIQGEFDSEHEAMTFLTGFVMGASGGLELVKEAREKFRQQAKDEHA